MTGHTKTAEKKWSEELELTMETRFLSKDEFIQTKALAEECFGEDEFTDDYYQKSIDSARIAVLYNDGEIVSMMHLHRFVLENRDRSIMAYYICYVGTRKSERRKGHMDRLMAFVLDTLKKERESLVFLVAVDREIYRHLGFTHDFTFSEEAREDLFADDELSVCSACILNDELAKPSLLDNVTLKKAQNIREGQFNKLTADLAADYYEYFTLRHNFTCDCSPINNVAYADDSDIQMAILDDRCMIMIANGEDGKPDGCIPFCRDEDLPYYFLMQERYFNEVLNTKFRAVWTDEAGVTYLRDAGVLNNYEILENPEIYDYIYSGDDLRTLAGRKYSKKRNHIHKFEQTYEERWEYRTLSFEDRDLIKSFMEGWDKDKMTALKNNGEQSIAGENIEETLDIDVFGTENVLNSEKLMRKVKAGGIFIDGKIKAFSMGMYNPLEKMAVIETEKADPQIEGLYQLINREFLIHEFPDAELINREDDVGLPGLRKAKLSYYPIMLAKRFTIRQL